jgi:hypothetical membrane protein
MIRLSVEPAEVTRPDTARRLLVCGVVAGPLFVLTVLLQAVTRAGFDPSRHPLSLLSLGEWGWIQVANFVVCGALFVAAAVGLRRRMVVGRASTWGPRLIGGFGLCLVWAGIFPADPADGFPAGAPEGAGELSWHGLLHSFGPAVAFLLLAAACVVFARRLFADGRKGWAVYCLVTAVALFIPDFFFASDLFTTTMYLALVVGWGWASAIAVAPLAAVAGRPAQRQ